VAQGHQLVLVGTAPAAPEYKVAAGDFADLAAELGADYFCDPLINRPEYIQMARESGAQVAISVNWPTLLGPAVFGAFEYGVINAHAGDLPRFRGNATPNWAILAGEEKVVVTLHEMAEGLDDGPIVAQREFPLGPSTYVSEVYDFLAVAVPDLFTDVLDRLDQGTLIAHAQPDAADLSLRCFPRMPRDGELDWRLPSMELARLVRASADPFPGAYSFLSSEKVVIWKAYPEELGYPYLGVPGQVIDIRRAAGEVAVLAGEGILVLEEIETAAGPRGPATVRLRSTRERFGMDITAEVTALLARVRKLEATVSMLPGRASDL
jgi:UDP-4-amino-4-deoxy-L-arabinose formyltransferase/UDP-glucuronic acid dehydrogenase (UDP-4-keto-hexauronic acid decarboxylating)